jgi:hypothetical protein
MAAAQADARSAAAARQAVLWAFQCESWHDELQ